MGTYLNPMTKDPMALEMLADVPRGTYAVWKRINDAPDKQWLQPANLGRLAKELIRDKPDWKGYYDGVETPLDFLSCESTSCGEPLVPWMLKSLWIHYVAKPEISIISGFMDNGFGRLCAPDSLLRRILRSEETSVGSTKIFTQMADLLVCQVESGRLVFNRYDWTIQAKTYIGEPFITCRPISELGIPEDQFRIGPKVKVAKLEGLSWS